MLGGDLGVTSHWDGGVGELLNCSDGGGGLSANTLFLFLPPPTLPRVDR